VSGSPLSYAAGAEEEDEDHYSATSSPVKAEQLDPWKLSRPIVESGQITDGEEMDRLANTVMQLQQEYADELIRGWVGLAADYAAVINGNPGTCHNIIELLNTLAEVDFTYSRVGLVTSQFVYEAMMTQYQYGLRRWCKSTICGQPLRFFRKPITR
jgi:hypothetical protein